jgi:hypothetical protein
MRSDPNAPLYRQAPENLWEEDLGFGVLVSGLTIYHGLLLAIQRPADVLCQEPAGIELKETATDS